MATDQAENPDLENLLSQLEDTKQLPNVKELEIEFVDDLVQALQTDTLRGGLDVDGIISEFAKSLQDGDGNINVEDIERIEGLDLQSFPIEKYTNSLGK